MRTTFFLLVLILGTAAFAQVKPGLDEHGVYHNLEIGFSFTPPGGLQDVTKNAGNSGNSDPKTVHLLLFELSGPNSADLNWRGVAVQSFPRSQVSAPNDFEAELKLSRTIVGNATEVGTPAKALISGTSYSMTRFQRTRGLVIEYTNVYATMVHDQIVAFAFTANSTSVISNMVDSLKTVQITPEKATN